MKNCKEENNRSDVKERIKSAALELFLKNGIREVKMDDIASLISVSKRTIYELFADKELLVTETLMQHQKLMHEEARQIIKDSTDTLDVILRLYGLFFSKLQKINHKFFADLARYPNLHNRNKEREKKNSKKFIVWMEEGRKQGLFREDADFKILLYIMKRELDHIVMLKTQKAEEVEEELSRYTSEQLGQLLILFYLRGIATPKGQEKIEEFMQKYQTTKNINYES